jgi:hypothetical protein
MGRWIRLPELSSPAEPEELLFWFRLPPSTTGNIAPKEAVNDLSDFKSERWRTLFLCDLSVTPRLPDFIWPPRGTDHAGGVSLRKVAFPMRSNERLGSETCR